LAERLAKGRLPVDEAVGIALQLAEGLEAAHEVGIVHRDFKPANLKVTLEGRLKVLDFGLARSSGTPQAEALTQERTVLGTPAYMAPEQAAGEQADRRADVWAFGCVLFEMLAGRRAFPGKTASDVLVAVLKGEVNWSVFPAHVPIRLRQLVE